MDITKGDYARFNSNTYLERCMRIYRKSLKRNIKMKLSLIHKLKKSWKNWKKIKIEKIAL